MLTLHADMQLQFITYEKSWQREAKDTVLTTYSTLLCHGTALTLVQCAEMEFLVMNFTKDSSLLIHAVHSLFYLRILQKIILYSGFKPSYRKIRETKNSIL